MDCSLDRNIILYSEFQVCMFSNGREMTKRQFLQDNDDDDYNTNTKAVEIPQVFFQKQPS